MFLCFEKRAKIGHAATRCALLNNRFSRKMPFEVVLDQSQGD